MSPKPDRRQRSVFTRSEATEAGTAEVRFVFVTSRQTRIFDFECQICRIVPMSFNEENHGNQIESHFTVERFALLVTSISRRGIGRRKSSKQKLVA
jgi:hypothetical protein